MTFFVSHSSKDKELVEMFCELLIEKFRINEDDIFCTSMNNSLRVGRDFITSIRDNLQSRDIAIFLITENYKSSLFCIMEMGAAWAFKDNIVPIIVPPVDFDFFNDTPLKTIQAMRLNSAADIMDKFYEKILCENSGYRRLRPERESLLRESVCDFVENVNEYAEHSFGFNIDTEKLIPVVQNSNPESMLIKPSDGEHDIDCDFSTNKFYPVPSNFMSCVMQFSPYKNWSNANLEWSFNFEACSEDGSVTDLILEIKSGETIKKVFECKFALTKTYEKFSVSLNEAKISDYHLKEISEICFVVRPNFVPGIKGKLKIKNIHCAKKSDK